MNNNDSVIDVLDILNIASDLTTNDVKILEAAYNTKEWKEAYEVIVFIPNLDFLSIVWNAMNHVKSLKASEVLVGALLAAYSPVRDDVLEQFGEAVLEPLEKPVRDVRTAHKN